MPTPPLRRDLAWRHFTESDLHRITYTIDLARWRDPAELSHRACRVLKFYAAAHRCGSVGYVGSRASYAAIGARIAKVTHEPASRSTVIRGVDELIAEGYIERARGRGDRKREIGPGEWIAEPLAVLTLTAKAIAIWTDKPSPAHLCPPVSSCNGYNSPRQDPGPLKGRDLSPETRIENAPPIITATLDEGENAESRADATDLAAAPAAAVVEPLPRHVASLAVLAGLERPEVGAGQGACQRQRLRFTSGTRPTSRPLAVAAVLATLARLTRSKREGSTWIARAEAEIAGRSDGPPSGVRWEYWIARWPELARGERDRLARSEVLPLLRLPSRCSPRIRGASPPASPPPSARPPAPPSPPPSPPARPPGPPAAIAEAEPDPRSPFADVYARQLARLAAKTATTCRSSES
jgi:hypothetical protein